MEIQHSIPITEIRNSLFEDKEVRLFVKREDLIHPFISGNKWRKLKYNIAEAKDKNCNVLLAFGGAYSNHIAAVAAAGKEFGFDTVGIIRGEEHKQLNPTLSFAALCGMKLIYVDRELYRNLTEMKDITGCKNVAGNSKWVFINKFADVENESIFFIPEGGANASGISGCMEIMNEVKDDYNFICCPCGTGTTIAGIILSLKKNQTAIGFSALKGGFMKSNVEQLLEDYSGRQIDANWMINENYHFGGYAKWNNELVTFIRKFRLDNKIPLDIVYTGKMFFGICDMIKNDYFPKGSKILVVHTGGLQGNKGFTEKTGIEI